MDDFHFEKKPSRITTKLEPFAVSKDKRGHWYEECIVHTAVYQKAPLRLNRNQIVKNQARSISRYCITLAKGIKAGKQLVSQ